MHVDAADLELELHSYERPLVASPFGAVKLVPGWDMIHVLRMQQRDLSLE